MYTQYFGLKERPFKLVPNPDYLYLSPSHEEVLAHLKYVITAGDGFLAITGEVGTGKTTLCRAFIESLDESTAVAYIFNPKLDAVQLLAAINDEFGIPSAADSTKDLIDGLNHFLIRQKQAGKQVVLLIDEAQNLSADVLEQLRLLSNLETTQDKLIQIILVGQPELYDLLDTRELRQLSQRVTLRRHLQPLNARDIRAYITHRVTLASRKVPVKFTRGAIRRIAAYSRGIPRLINMVCDRALLTAFGMNRRRITGGVVKVAIGELQTGPRSMLKISARRLLLWALILAVPVLGISWIMYPDAVSHLPSGFFSKFAEVQPNESAQGATAAVLPPEVNLPEPVSEAEMSAQQPHPDSTDRPLSTDPVTVEPDSVAMPLTVSRTVGLPATSLPKTPVTPEQVLNAESYLQTLHGKNTRKSTIAAILDLWDISPSNDTAEGLALDVDNYFIWKAQQSGLSVHILRNNLNLAKILNVPVILSMDGPKDGNPVYLTLYRYEVLPATDKSPQETWLYLRSGPEDPGIAVTEKSLARHLGGKAYVFWKNFYGYAGVIPITAPQGNIITLKLHLRKMGYPDMDVTAEYDAKTRNTIRSVQARYHIAVDGLVGPITQLALYNETPDLPVPRLR